MGFIIAVLIIAIVIGALFWCFYEGDEEGAKGALADMSGFIKGNPSDLQFPFRIAY